MPDSRTEVAAALMLDFAERTGLTPERWPRRYLWTDAFAVCNFLGLEAATGEDRFRQLALRLVDQVHHVLGRHRGDDGRRGWISGLAESEGEAHPTAGGLRIGKQLPERGADEPYDPQVEWDRDGQYFHYLTKWMHALDQISRATGNPQLNGWARELAATAYRAFSYRSPVGRPRMYWKMSTDLSRPLVPSMGQHDPLDGYVTALQLNVTTAALGQELGGSDLQPAADEYLAMAERADWTSPDALGIGGLLVDAYRLVQLIDQGAAPAGGFLERLLTAAGDGLRYYATSGELSAGAEYRLAFRELGLAIGLQAVERMAQTDSLNPTAAPPAIRRRLDSLLTYIALGDRIESFWRDPAHRQVGTWMEHRDINEVMLATRLLADGFLRLTPAKQ